MPADSSSRLPGGRAPPPPPPMADDHRLHYPNPASSAALSSSSTTSSGGDSSSSSKLPPSLPPPSLAPPPLPPPPLLSSHQHHQQLLHNHPQRLLSLHLNTSSPPSLPPPSTSKLSPLRPPSPPPERPSRDDCWSEGATLTLINAWGDRYLELNRGNLKQKHWKDVADAVNGRADGSKVPKTDVQCKNRLDTLKKKYKLEKSKIAGGEGPSKWAFFDRLDGLIGPSKKPKKPIPVKVLPSLVAASKRPADEVDQKQLVNNVAAATNHLLSAADTISKSKESPDMTDSCPNGLANIADGNGFKRKRSYDSPFKDLARAIFKFGEIYERIETAKQQQMVDLEKQRMEFTKDLELQRLQLFMQTQVELAKMKHSKHGSTEHYL